MAEQLESSTPICWWILMAIMASEGQWLKVNDWRSGLVFVPLMLQPSWTGAAILPGPDIPAPVLGNKWMYRINTNPQVSRISLWLTEGFWSASARAGEGVSKKTDKGHSGFTSFFPEKLCWGFSEKHLQHFVIGNKVTLLIEFVHCNKKKAVPS